MSENAEAGIAAAQARAAQADGVKKHHDASIGYLNERITTFVAVIVLLSLLLVWLNTTSATVTWTTLTAAIAVIVAWGMFRIRSIQRQRVQREQEVKAWKSSC